MVSFCALCIANIYHWSTIGVSGGLGTSGDKGTHRRKIAEIEMEDMIR
jgi:hypothetical protein